MALTAVDIPAFASSQQTLLAAELAAELSETASHSAAASPAALQRAGRAVLNLVVGSRRTGLGGRTVIELVRDAAVGGGELEGHGIRVGDVVGVSERVAGAAKKREKTESEKKGVEGVVVRCGREGISVALDGEDDVPGERLWL